jgi:hypothetical protein
VKHTDLLVKGMEEGSARRLAAIASSSMVKGGVDTAFL